MTAQLYTMQMFAKMDVGAMVLKSLIHVRAITAGMIKSAYT